jgi:Branched-chain amino acid ABC-type transport system, permease components
VDIELLVNTLVSGLLLGGFYALATVGLTLAFGVLDVVNIAHPAFMVLGAMVAMLCATATGLDPVLVGVLLLPAFFALGYGFYGVYFRFFEKRGDAAIQGLAFFFAVMFVIEVSMSMALGPEQRQIETPYSWTTWQIGMVEVPLRMLVPFCLGMAVLVALSRWLRSTFIGRTVSAVGQDQQALRFVGVDPVRVKRIAFGIAIAAACLAGSGLLLVQPVDPWSGHTYIGRVFSICILGGLASLRGTWLAALIFGVLENFTSTYVGPAWSLAVAFGLLLLTLLVRPQGLFAR